MAIEKYLRPREAGDLLGVSGQTATKWAKEGKITYYETEGGQVRFRRKDVEAYKKELETEASKKKAEEEVKQLRRKRRELTPLQKKLRDQMRRAVHERIEACRTGENRFIDAFTEEELHEIIPNRRLLWVTFFIDDEIPQEAWVSPRELTIDCENRVIHLREVQERRFRTVYFDRVYGVK